MSQCLAVCVRILGAVLLLSNITFKDPETGSSGKAIVENEEALDQIAKLLELPKAALLRAITTNELFTNGMP